MISECPFVMAILTIGRINQNLSCRQSSHRLKGNRLHFGFYNLDITLSGIQ
jgi:hypothetical protein